MMSPVASHILGLAPWAALLVVFALPALESSAFVGFIFPGEIALIFGGVLASQGSVPLAAVLVAGIVGAVVGDSIGYAVGRRYGRRLLDGTLGRFVHGRHLDRAEAYLAARGARAVFFGRFTAALRVMVPGLAGMAGVRYRTFVTYNVASAIGWVTLSVMLGYLGGSSWQHVAHIASSIGLAALAALVLAALGGYLLRHTKPPRLRRLTTRLRASRSAARLQALFPRATAWGPPRPHQEHLRSDPMTTPDPADTRPSPRFGPRGTVVVIPTYNEAGNATTVLDRVRAAAPGVDVLIVDDSSPDGTAAIVACHPGYADLSEPTRRGASGRVFLLSRPAKGGLGAAYRAGFAWALAHDYDAMVQMDADLSHPPEAIPALLDALAQADVAVGSRYVHGGSVENWAWSRRLISSAGNTYVRLVLGVPVHDTTAGFKAFRRDALERIGAVHSTANGYCFQIENTWRAVQRGLRVREVPITFTDRTVGASKMSTHIVAEALTRVLLWRLRDLLRGSSPAAARRRPTDGATASTTRVHRDQPMADRHAAA